LTEFDPSVVWSEARFALEFSCDHVGDYWATKSARRSEALITRIKIHRDHAEI